MGLYKIQAMAITSKDTETDIAKFVDDVISPSTIFFKNGILKTENISLTHNVNTLTIKTHTEF